ncbi:MAG: AgmX/PglI C-terminal domain-containing protein [Myxococcaceae bacterium]
MNVAWLLAAWVLTAEPSAGLATLLKGPLTPLTIKDVIHEHRADVRKCADARTPAQQTVAGKVVVHFMIGMEGALSHVRLESSTLNEPKLEQCMVNAVKGWRFPKPKHSRVEVNFPFWVGPQKKTPPGREPPDDKAPDESEPDVLK